MPDLEAIKHVPTAAGINELIASRWSPRAFSDEAIPADDLQKIFTAASWAASSSNEQPWRFLIGHKGDETYNKIFNCLVEFNQLWAKSAPVLVLTLAKTTFTKEGSPNNAWALHDVGAASANMCLQAVALGIHTHGMAGFDKDKVRTHFNVPAEFTEGAIWAMGYLGDHALLPEKMQTMELAPRTRKPLNEIVFTDWGVPAKF